LSFDSQEVTGAGIPGPGVRQTARRMFVVVPVAVGAAVMMTGTLANVFGLPEQQSTASLPGAFVFSTLVLALGSMALEQARARVKRELQSAFRRSLLISLLLTVVFSGVQSYGIWCLLRMAGSPTETQTGVFGFLFVFVFLHAMHVSVAELFVIFVTLQAFVNRYDHEYHWGVTVCAWFWHVLGVAWLAILFVFLTV